MSAAPLDFLPLWLFFVAVIVFTLAALEFGFRFGKWRHARAIDENQGPTAAMVAAILGLLAFMLAFTFSMAASRFDARRQTVLEEANAIGTAYLRARLLPEPEGSAIAGLLKEYVDVRVRGVQENNVAEAIARSEKLHVELWNHVAAAAEKNSQSIMTGVFVQSLNEVIDLHSTRLLVGMRSRIPISIWAGLFGLALIGMASMGYQAGLSSARRSPAMLFLSLAFATVILLIADLDRAHEGYLQVSQQALIDLQTSMQSSD